MYKIIDFINFRHVFSEYKLSLKREINKYNENRSLKNVVIAMRVLNYQQMKKIQ